MKKYTLTDHDAVCFVHKYILYLSPYLYDKRTTSLGINIIEKILLLSKVSDIIDIDYIDREHLLSILKQEYEINHTIDEMASEFVVLFLRKYKTPKYNEIYLGILNDTLWSITHD